MTATVAPLPALPTPADDRPHLVARPVLTARDALHMGLIRNRRRHGFSHDTSPISPERQLAWWHANRDRLIAYLYAEGDTGRVVGYGCLRQEPDGRWYSSCAVDEGFGGRGYGRTLLTHLALSVPFDIWATARDDNPAAQRLHDPLIWDTIGYHEGLWLYRTRPKVRLAAPSLASDEYAGSLGQ